VALARALVIQPQVLLMDEPLSNLDAKLRLQVRQTIAELQAEAGITTVFVTHDQDEALALSHQIGVMNQGRLEQVGTPAQIYREPATGYVADFVGAANLLPVEMGAAVAAGGTAMVPVAGAAVAARAPAALPAGRATLVARPEAIALIAPQAGGLQGRITSRQFLGDKTSYRVDIGGGLGLDVDCHGAGHDLRAVGDAVGLLPDPAATLVLAG
jgi:iron(III) transport system ATP-binding protein